MWRLWFILMLMLVLGGIQGIWSRESPVVVPSPEERLSIQQANMLYLLVSRELVKNIIALDMLKEPAPSSYIRALERILLDFPDGRIILRRGLGLPETIELAGIHKALSICYFAERRWDEALALTMQNFFWFG